MLFYPLLLGDPLCCCATPPYYIPSPPQQNKLPAGVTATSAQASYHKRSTFQRARVRSACFMLSGSVLVTEYFHEYLMQLVTVKYLVLPSECFCLFSACLWTV